MNVEVVTIGDELLLGFTVDTNAAHLSRELAAAGIQVSRRATVGDHAETIARTVGEALERTGGVITTGGLGPTADDRSKAAVAALFGRALRFDESIWASIQEIWTRRGYTGAIPQSNREQAMVPEGARILTNRHGSAPGIWLEDERGRWVAMLPGVPREMRGMLADALFPILRDRVSGDARTVIRSRTVRTAGIAESAVADRLGDLARAVDGMPLAYLPGVDGVDLRLTTEAPDAITADRRLQAAAQSLHERLGPYVYGDDDTDLAALVLERCRERGLRIAVAESCTGGLLGARLTAVPGASTVFLGGTIAYDDEAKRGLLGVDAHNITEFGAVSEQVVMQMASGARARFGADIGIGITGIAGPSGGTPGKPVGTVWLAVDISGTVRARRIGVSGDRTEIRQRAAQSALDMVRRAL